MPKRKQPETSLEANELMTDDIIQLHHAKIYNALLKIGNGIYEKIAEVAGMEKNQVSRRLKEMLGSGIVEVTEEKRKTSSNRNAFVYRIPIDKVEEK